MKVIRFVISFCLLIIVSQIVSRLLESVFYSLRAGPVLRPLVTKVEIIVLFLFGLYSNPSIRVSSVYLVLLERWLVMSFIEILSLVIRASLEWAHPVVNRHLLFLDLDWLFSKVTLLV